MKPFRVLKSSVPSPLVLNIPHASSVIPSDEAEQFSLGGEALLEFVDEAVDWYTDELYDVTSALGGSALIQAVNRVVVDTERFEDDASEPMSQKGLGAIYTRTYKGEVLRRQLSSSERERLLAQYFRPYHAELERLTSEAVEAFGYCLLIDCHSFGSIRGPSPFYEERSLPELCLGTDSRHSPAQITKALSQKAESLGFKTALDFPYAGTVVPLSWYGDSRVIGFMLELNKSCYLSSGTTERSAEFSSVRSKLTDLIGHLLNVAKDYSTQGALGDHKGVANL